MLGPIGENEGILPFDSTRQFDGMNQGFSQATPLQNPNQEVIINYGNGATSQPNNFQNFLPQDDNTANIIEDEFDPNYASFNN